MAFTLQSATGQLHVWLYADDTGKLERISQPGDVSERSPRFSRDGRHLTFVRDLDSIWVLDLATKQQRPLPVRGASPSFSPAGDRLCFIGAERELRVFDLTSGDETTIAWSRGLATTAVEWSPAQDFLLLSLEGSGSGGRSGLDLAVYDLTNGLVRTIGSWFHDARWSPKGEMVFAERNVVDLFGRTVRPVDLGVALAWSRNAQGYLGLTAEGYRILDFAGNPLWKLELPEGYRPPRLIDYGTYEADWSFN